MLGKIFATASSLVVLATTIASAALAENSYSVTTTTRTAQSETVPGVETVPSMTIRERSYVVQPAAVQPIYVEPSSTTTVIKERRQQGHHVIKVPFASVL